VIAVLEVERWGTSGATACRPGLWTITSPDPASLPGVHERNRYVPLQSTMYGSPVRSELSSPDVTRAYARPRMSSITRAATPFAACR
jgi:hypothetical protein